MITYAQAVGTYTYELNKPENRLVLKAYIDYKDKSPEVFVRYALWLFSTLRGTPAWNKPGTNEMLNEVLVKVRATLANAKRGKSSAYAHAGYLLNKIDYLITQEAHLRNPGPCKLMEELTVEELRQYGIVIDGVQNGA